MNIRLPLCIIMCLLQLLSRAIYAQDNIALPYVSENEYWKGSLVSLDVRETFTNDLQNCDSGPDNIYVVAEFEFDSKAFDAAMIDVLNEKGELILGGAITCATIMGDISFSSPTLFPIQSYFKSKDGTKYLGTRYYYITSVKSTKGRIFISIPGVKDKQLLVKTHSNS